MTATMSNSVGNGRKRPNLSDQIDRLDNMLEGLSQGLNDAVADAVKHAVASAAHEAVQGVLAEILINPVTIAKLKNSFAPTVMARMPTPVSSPSTFSRDSLKSLWAGIRDCVAGLRSACSNGVRKVQPLATSYMRKAVETAVGIWASCQIVRRFKLQLLTAIGIGAALGVLAWTAGPSLAAVCSFVGGFATTLSVQAGLWLRQAVGGAVDEEVHV